MRSPNMKLTIGGNNTVMVSPDGVKISNGTPQNMSGKPIPGKPLADEKKGANIIQAKVPAVSVKSTNSPVSAASTLEEPKPEIGML